MNWLKISLFFVSFFSNNVLAEDKPCWHLDLTGNGEALVEHGPMISKIVDKMGMPCSMAGGSSASASIFMLDSLAGNKELNLISNEDQKKKMQALMIRTFPFFLQKMVIDDAQIPAIMQIVSGVKGDQTFMEKLGVLKEGIKKSLTEKEIESILGRYAGLVSKEIIKGMASPYSSTRQRYFGFAVESAKMLTSFDATDPNLFFRPGVIDFKHFAEVVGAIGDFYKGNFGKDEGLKNDFLNFVKSCHEESYQHAKTDKNADCSLKKLSTRDGGKSCEEKFNNLVNKYLASNNLIKNKNEVLNQKVGANIPTYISTGVLQGESYKNYKKIRSDFLNGKDEANISNRIKSFQVAHREDLKCGYYGNSNGDIDNVSSKLKAEGNTDPKSEMITALDSKKKPATWKTALTRSLAEPGMSSFIELDGGSATMGGFCDLQPSLTHSHMGNHGKDDLEILFTREGPMTGFGRGILTRIMGETEKAPHWKFMAKGIMDQNQFKALLGRIKKAEKPDPSDLAARDKEIAYRKELFSYFGLDSQKVEDDKIVAKAVVMRKSYNDHGNWPGQSSDTFLHQFSGSQPSSSFMKGLDAATGISCSNWDAFDVFKGSEELERMISDSCNSPLFVKNGAPGAKYLASMMGVKPQANPAGKCSRSANSTNLFGASEDSAETAPAK